MNIGIRINRLLFENHMEQKDLAEALNFTQASMSRWVKGTRVPKTEALCAIADYFDVSVDWLLGRSEYQNYNGFISGDDALEYCRKAKESAWKCWYKVANFDVTEISATSLANNTQACAHFEREILRWEYDIPRMIHSLADGTWKESEGRKTEPQPENLFTDKDGDVWEWRGDAWYCISGQDEPQTDCPWK